MKHKSRKLKFLTVKLKSMQSELEISKEILHTAGSEVENSTGKNIPDKKKRMRILNPHLK